MIVMKNFIKLTWVLRNSWYDEVLQENVCDEAIFNKTLPWKFIDKFGKYWLKIG